VCLYSCDSIRDLSFGPLETFSCFGFSGFLSLNHSVVAGQIPFFFDEQQVTELVNSFKKVQPDLASSIKIEVVILEGVLDALKQGEDEMLSKIILWPSKESLDFLRANAPKK